MSIPVKKVAEYLLFLDSEDSEISNMKLQKLIYYCQGFHLAAFGKPLFDEEILAWQHGPVVESIWRDYKDYGRNPIDPPSHIDFSDYPEESIELMDDVFKTYGQYSAWRLRELTHCEPPWKLTPRDKVISHKLMQEYFVTQLTDEETKAS